MIHRDDRRLIDAKVRALKRGHASRRALAAHLVVSAVLLAVLVAAAYPWPRIALLGAIMAVSALVEHRTRDRVGGCWQLVELVAPFLVVAVTGGVRSPMFPALVFGCAPVLMVVTYAERHPRWMYAGAASIAVLTLLPEEIRGPALAAPYDLALTGGTLVAALLAVAKLVHRLELGDALVDAEMRRLRGDLLHEALERSRTFEAVAAKVGHELKTPIAAIRVLAELEHRKAQSDTSRERLGTVLSEARRMQAIVEDYLVLAKPIEALEIAPYDLAALVGEIVHAFRETSERAGVEIVAMHAESVPMAGDRRRIREAITNLVSNALEASPRGGSVEVRIEDRDERVEVEVVDRGRGIPSHLLPRVGTAFFTTREGGTGLGVVLARTVVMQHGGRLSLESHEGRGTTAHVLLPRRAVAGVGAAEQSVD